MKELPVCFYYTVFASAIRKDRYIRKYGKLSNDVYELALSFIVERTVFYIDTLTDENTQLHIIIEKRGKKEDKKLQEHFQRLMARGTGYVSAARLKELNIKITFRDKKENVNGLQLADLLAYPIARYVIDNNRANPAFDLLAPNFYTKNGKRYGLKRKSQTLLFGFRSTGDTPILVSLYTILSYIVM